MSGEWINYKMGRASPHHMLAGVNTISWCPCEKCLPVHSALIDGPRDSRGHGKVVTATMRRKASGTWMEGLTDRRGAVVGGTFVFMWPWFHNQT